MYQSSPPSTSYVPAPVNQSFTNSPRFSSTNPVDFMGNSIMECPIDGSGNNNNNNKRQPTRPLSPCAQDKFDFTTGGIPSYPPSAIDTLAYGQSFFNSPQQQQQQQHTADPLTSSLQQPSSDFPFGTFQQQQQHHQVQVPAPPMAPPTLFSIPPTFDATQLKQFQEQFQQFQQQQLQQQQQQQSQSQSDTTELQTSLSGSAIQQDQANTTTSQQQQQQQPAKRGRGRPPAASKAQPTAVTSTTAGGDESDNETATTRTTRRSTRVATKAAQQQQQQQDNTLPYAGASLSSTTAGNATTATTIPSATKRPAAARHQPQQQQTHHRDIESDSDNSEDEHDREDWSHLPPDERARKERLARKAQRARVLRRERLDRLSNLELENKGLQATIVEYELTIAQHKLMSRAFQDRIEHLEMLSLFFQTTYGPLDEKKFEQFVQVYNTQQKQLLEIKKNDADNIPVDGTITTATATTITAGAKDKTQDNQSQIDTTGNKQHAILLGDLLQQQEQQQQQDEEKQQQKPQNTMNDNQSPQQQQQEQQSTTMNDNEDEDDGNYVNLKPFPPHQQSQTTQDITTKLENQITNNNVDISKHMLKKLTINEEQQQIIQAQRQQQSVGLLGHAALNKDKLNINNITVSNLGLSHTMIDPQPPITSISADSSVATPATATTTTATYASSSNVTAVMTSAGPALVHKPGLKCPNGNKILVNPNHTQEFEMLHVLRAELTTSAERLLHAIAIVNDSITKHTHEKK